MSVQVSTRIDEATKKQFDRICEAIGISPSNAISMFIKGVINHNGIPFSPVISEKAVRPPFEFGILPEKMPREAVFGCMRGQFAMADDFDAPLEDFREYME
ncbi:MAG: type II toxin-antitoxin system RelB/DinJ family antitoxin [Oscillospiraceae bacterium]|nr:type II toxin-antitoxin system RelB/DinJ family antitoxin [Oscillospiraceae bacterium]